MLKRRDTLPEGFLEARAGELAAMLGGPTLIELPGERAAPLFVSILMHGNEDVGLGAIQRVLRAYDGRSLPRALMLMVGNVSAAAQGVRRLDHQPDFNRVWPGTLDHVGTVEAAMMAEIHERVLARGAFAAIDLHNNTGRNPFYSVICEHRPEVLELAARFARRAVLFRGVPGTQTASFAGHIPAMTAECGKPGSPAHEEAAARFVADVLESETLGGDREGGALDLYHTLGVVRVREDVSLSFAGEAADLSLAPDIDRLNFVETAAGEAFGRASHPMPLTMIDEAGRDVAEEFFAVEQGELRLARPVTPAMLTGDPQIVRQDCLGYLMERLAPA
ncbi:M14 family metallopeptidase [Erythrobacter sp.]|uniref:M14 family metallopeptidase n=1 Tax=Erythrobacter sp. TaxID=1042 RepID=UPI001425F1A4|nr:M14 family metallopeptidase [Erythrobacter sp.]QIQ86529.1 MAG: peptidase M14 [Erythrobacter sp.]